MFSFQSMNKEFKSAIFSKVFPSWFMESWSLMKLLGSVEMSMNFCVLIIDDPPINHTRKCLLPYLLITLDFQWNRIFLFFPILKLFDPRSVFHIHWFLTNSSLLNREMERGCVKDKSLNSRFSRYVIGVASYHHVVPLNLCSIQRIL